MSSPTNFSWIERPLLAACAQPADPAEMAWLRQQNIELIVTLTEEPLRRDWLSDASLLAFHVPMEDMQPPTHAQVNEALSAIKKAHERGMGVAVQCMFGLGRTGTLLACYFVEKGMNARDAIRHVRRLRPGSIETHEQEEFIGEYARARSA